MKLGILKSFKEIDHLIQSYVDACDALGIKYVIIDLLGNNWLDEIKNSGVDGFLVRIKGNIPEQKSLYDERLMIINEDLGIPIYPSRKELFLYENKRMYAYWLQANNFPFVDTYVFYKKKQALAFLRDAELPLVLKTNGGASSSGVDIIRSKTLAASIIHRVFGFFDARMSFGKLHWSQKWIIPVPKFGMVQKHYLIIQRFIPIKWEWRIIKIGNSYFGHQKLLKGDFASGSDLVGWVEPPKELLFLIKDVCEKGKFDSMAMDVLESIEGQFYINELQSLFGSFLPYQMKINGIPGRFILKNGEYIFEEGEFNKFGSNLLRVEDFVNKLNQSYYK